MDSNRLHTANEAVHTLRRQVRVATCQFRPERNFLDLCKNSIAEEQNHFPIQCPLHTGSRWPSAADQGLDENDGVEDDSRRSQCWFR